CCDLFAAAHVGNPCGHCFCGECGWAWISKNRRHPTCAVCRAALSGDMPMIPNFTLDSMVEKHINALVVSGDTDWLAGGSKYRDWHERKEYVPLIAVSMLPPIIADPQEMETRRREKSGEAENHVFHQTIHAACAVHWSGRWG
ncbi:hypothetical protein GLOTRDRAFT_30008, partial [Gloeophyllum trabeum ATCC 11539]